MAAESVHPVPCDPATGIRAALKRWTCSGVHQQVEALRAIEVAALEQDGGAEHFRELARCGFERGFVRDFFPEQGFRFGQVRRDDPRER